MKTENVKDRTSQVWDISARGLIVLVLGPGVLKYVGIGEYRYRHPVLQLTGNDAGKRFLYYEHPSLPWEKSDLARLA